MDAADPHAPEATPAATGEPAPLPAPQPLRGLLVLAGALLVLAAAVVAYTMGVRSVTDTRPAPLPVGPKAPAERPVAPVFAMPSLTTPGRISLADFRGKVVVLNFFASWCGPCALEAATLEQTWREHRDHGVVFLGVAIQDRERDARAFLERHGITYPAVFDANGEVMLAYRVVGIPTTFFIDPAGRIAGSHAGIFVGEAGAQRLGERIDAARRDPR
ncbi:MAG: TlpA disulfide reductase family protein [Armatimonadota bacterium]|nr:TlpA disulfide reductase family protein [Armatimonadota bacterium]